MQELNVIINQTQIIANIAPQSIEKVIYTKCIVVKNKLIKGDNKICMDVLGLSRRYADEKGYSAPLLKNLEKLGELLKKRNDRLG